MDLWTILNLVKENGITAIVIVLIITSLIQITPIKINPWTAVIKKIGSTINADISEELKHIHEDIDRVEKSLNTHIEADDERDADMRRQRILRFNADIMRGINFSHEYFCEMLIEVDTYEKYCKDHPSYRNSRATMAVSNIKRTCEVHEQNNDWAIE